MDSLNLQSSNVASRSPCNWVSCATRLVARTETEIAAHLKVHLQETLRQWSGPRGCIWKECPSKSTFKSPGAFKSHIFNIHVSPLVCTFPQCTYTKPFGKKYDLDRHVATTHAASSTHVCPVESCDANTNGFARKDKLLNHIREEHDNLRCPYNHCYAIVLATEQDAHLQEVHGSFECALGACEHGPASCFRKVGLKRHFRKHHNMTVDPTQTVMAKTRKTMDKTARSPHIARLRTWKDCPTCSEAQRGSRSELNHESSQIQNGD